MIDSKLGHAGFRIGIYVVLVAGGLSWLTEEGTAERAISMLTFIIGLVFLGIVIVLVWVGRR
jgi:preprotein translocase subunit SecG